VQPDLLNRPHTALVPQCPYGIRGHANAATAEDVTSEEPTDAVYALKGVEIDRLDNDHSCKCVR